jgi:hypothetical protein
MENTLPLQQASDTFHSTSKEQSSCHKHEKQHRKAPELSLPPISRYSSSFIGPNTNIRCLEHLVCIKMCQVVTLYTKCGSKYLDRTYAKVPRQTKYDLASMHMAKKTNGEFDCVLKSNPPCNVVVDNVTINKYCLNHVSCTTCKMYVENPNLKANVGPLHWQGKACKQSGQDVRDFAYEKKP